VSERLFHARGLATVSGLGKKDQYEVDRTIKTENYNQITRGKQYL